jgi:hypothetical protein
MYQPYTQFPQITNRESWTQLIGIYDDDTGAPINLSNTSGTGTFAQWSVQISASLYSLALISTLSSTSLKIGNGIFNDVIPAGLAILAGQYITYTSQAATANWMTGQVISYNSITGAIQFSIVSVSIQLEIRRRSNRGGMYGDGYGPPGEFGGYDNSGPILTAAIGNGVSIVDIGIIQVYFSETSFRQLARGEHLVAATLKSSDGIDVRQLFLGLLPVFDGGVTN